VRLLLVTRGFPPRVGGVETLCRQLAEGFADRGVDVVVVTYAGRAPASAPASASASAEADTVAASHTVGDGGAYRVIRLRSRGDVFEWSGRIVATVRAQRFDVCHVHNLHSTVAGAVWASGRRPYVLTSHYHGGGHTRAARLVHPAYRTLARRVVRDAAAVTAVSASEAALIRRDFGRDPEVIPNGVEPRSPAGATRPAGPPTIVAVSRLVGYKRVDAAIAALPDLPGFRLRVVGDGPQRAELIGLARRLGVHDRLDLDARRLSDADVLTAVRDASVLVNLSEAEAFSYTVLESLAAGTPVVTSRSGALAEWASRFPGSVLAAEPAGVAAAVRRLAGRRVSVDLGEYALPAILDRYARVYARAAGGGEQ
jgi:glycosyltransferase involved in cell wall biosynthesis